MAWIWLLLIIIAIIADFFSSDFLFSGFALGSIIALLLSILNVNIVLQIVIFGAIGILFIFTLYPVIKKKIRKDNLGTPLMENNYIGKSFILDKDVNLETLIKFNGIYWTFKSDIPLTKGTKVKITKIIGNKLFIEKL